MAGRRQALRHVALVALAAAGVLSLAPTGAAAPKVRTWTIHYRAANGQRRAAYVLLPAWYGPRRNPAIPLVISPHGRGLDGRKNARLWGALPARGDFAVVNPDGLSRYSWGSTGQIHDLTKMPVILHLTLPWLRIDPRRIYAFGGSMGGQETLLLLARAPHMLAGAAAFDSVTDFARQYRAFPDLGCNRSCRRNWSGPIGRSLQRLARKQIGGTPKSASYAFRLRSPVTYLRRIAFSCVPLQLWWSVADKVVLDQQHQSGTFFWRLRQLNRAEPVQAFVGNWIHSSEMTAKTELPVALRTFGLLPGSPAPPEGIHWVPPQPPSSDCGS